MESVGHLWWPRFLLSSVLLHFLVLLRASHPLPTCAVGQVWARSRDMVSSSRGNILLVALSASEHDRSFYQNLSSMTSSHSSLRVLLLLPPSTSQESLLLISSENPALIVDRDEMQTRRRLGIVNHDNLLLFDRCGRLVRSLHYNQSDTRLLLKTIKQAQQFAVCGFCQHDKETVQVDAYVRSGAAAETGVFIIPTDRRRPPPPSPSPFYRIPSSPSPFYRIQPNTNSDRRFHPTRPSYQNTHVTHPYQSPHYTTPSSHLLTYIQYPPSHLLYSQSPRPPNPPPAQPIHSTRQEVSPNTESPTDLEYGDYEDFPTTKPAAREGRMERRDYREEARVAGRQSSVSAGKSEEKSLRRGSSSTTSTTTPPPSTTKNSFQYTEDDYPDYTFAEEATAAVSSTETPPEVSPNQGDSWSATNPLQTQLEAPRAAALTAMDEDVPCSAVTDDICFHQRKSGRKMSSCCTKGVYLVDFCQPGKCSNATIQPCCLQKFLQSRYECCMDASQEGVAATDAFSRCCHSHFVMDADECCPFESASTYWNSVHEICLPNVQVNLSHIHFEVRVSEGIRVVDLAEREKWEHECRYGRNRTQFVYLP